MDDVKLVLLNAFSVFYMYLCIGSEILKLSSLIGSYHAISHSVLSGAKQGILLITYRYQSLTFFSFYSQAYQEYPCYLPMLFPAIPAKAVLPSNPVTSKLFHAEAKAL